MTARGAYILGLAGTTLSDKESGFFKDSDPWGFILFGRNVDTPDQMRRLTGDLRASVGWDIPILIDQEGGRVQRMTPPHWRQWDPPLDQMIRSDPETRARGIYLRYLMIAAELNAVGIDVNCAPTADLATADTHPFLRNRCFGRTVEDVVTGARACAEGLMAGGVLPVMKHLPGHGRATLDTHKSLPRVSESKEELMGADFAVFKKLADLPMAMTAHIVFDAIDPTAPATISTDCAALIRNEFGFAGLLMTDDIGMNALSGTVAERTKGALAAGCDLVLHCNGEMDEMEEVVQAAGQMSEPAVERGAAALSSRRAPVSFDMKDVEDEFLSCAGPVTYAR